MSSSEPSNSKTHPSRAYTIWTGKRPVIRPLVKPDAPEPEKPAAAESAPPLPSQAFTLWTVPKDSADSDEVAAQVPEENADAITESEAKAEAPPVLSSRAFTIWTIPAATATGGGEPSDEDSSGKDEPVPAVIPPAPSTTPPEPERGGGGGGILGVGAAALVALVFGLLGKEYHNDLKVLQSSNEELRNQLTQATSENAAANAGLRKDLSAADEKLSGKINTLTAEKSALQKNLAAADKKLTDQFGALSLEKEKLAASLASAEKKLTDQVAKLSREKAALEKQLAGQVAALNTSKVAIEKSLADGNKKVANQIDDLNAAKTDLQMRLLAEKTRIEGLLKNVETLQGEFAKEKTVNKGEFSKIRVQLDSAKSSIERLIRALSGLGKS